MMHAMHDDGLLSRACIAAPPAAARCLDPCIARVGSGGADGTAIANF